MRGVVEVVEGEESEEAHAKLEDALLEGLASRSASSSRRGRRRARGSRPSWPTSSARSRALVERAASASARQPVAIMHRLGEQIARLMESQFGLDPERLHQEALLLAAKTDIQEELDRLRSHVTAAQDLLTQDQPVGRRLNSWRRSSTARPTPSAPRRPISRSAAPGSSSRR